MYKLLDKLSNYIPFIIGVIIGTILGLCIFFYTYIDEATYKTLILDTKFDKGDLINATIAIGTFSSAIGLIYFSYLTYKNQKINSFQNEFSNLLKEHNRILAECFYENNKFNFHLHYLLHKASSPKADFNYVSEGYIYGREEVSRYFIFLYRLLDRIYSETSIKNERKRYIGILRVLIPHQILLLVAINSLHTDYQRYKELLEKSSFLEHLPVSERFFKDIRLTSAKYLKELKDNIQNQYYFELHSNDINFEENINQLEYNNKLPYSDKSYDDYIDKFLNKLFSEKIWGNNIYRRKYLENKFQNHN